MSINRPLRETIQFYRDEEKWIKSVEEEKEQQQELTEMVQQLRNGDEDES